MTVRGTPVALALLAVVYALRSMLAAGFFLVVLLVWARLGPARALAGVTIERRHPARLFHGESADFEVILHNPGRIRLPWLWLTDSIPFDLSPRSFRWATTLSGGETRAARFRMTGSRRGIYRLGPGTFVTGDLFGLRPVQRSDRATTRLVVFPRIVPLPRLGLPARAPFPELRTGLPLYEDPIRVVGVRPYLPTDSARRIHWSATAHQGSLVVRQYQHGIGRDTMVILDLSRPGLGSTRSGRAELAITAAASVLHHIVTVERLRAGLRMPGVTVAAGRDHPHLMTMLELLAGASAVGKATGLDDPVGLPFGASLLVILGRLDERWHTSLRTLRSRGWQPSVLWVGDDLPAVPAGVTVRRVSADHDLAVALSAPAGPWA